MDISINLSIFITKHLYAKGWFFVGSDTSGLMKKNDLLLVLHSNSNRSNNYEFVYSDYVDVRDLYTSNESCFTTLPMQRSFVNPKRCNWHIEQNGWLIGKGTFQDACEELVSVDNPKDDFPQIYAMFESELNKINEIADYSVIEKDRNKSREALVEKEEVILVPKSVKPNFVVGSYFRAVDSKIFSIFQEGVVYKIHSIDNETGQIIIKTLNDTFTKEKKISDFSADGNAFLQLAKNHLIETVELDYSTKKKSVISWVSMNIEETTSVKLPDTLKDYCVNKDQEYFITLAYSKGYNVTPLLIPDLSIEYYKNILSFLEQGTDLSELIQVDAPEEMLLYLANLKSIGYDLNDIILNQYSLYELKDIINETNTEFNREHGDFASVCTYPESIEFLKAQFFSTNKINALKLNKPRVYLELLSKSKKFPNSIYAKLIENGFISNTCVYLTTDSFNKKDLQEYLEQLGNVFDLNLNSNLSFDQVGFMNSNLFFENSKILLTSDSNSLCVKNKGNDQIECRVLLLDDKKIICGNKEILNV